MCSRNETIFCEILPELCRVYEQKRFSESLNIFISNLRFGDNEEECNGVAVRINNVKCVANFENCQAVKQKRMNEDDEMMFGIFGEESSQIKNSDISPEIESLNARLILPKASDQYVSHIEIRNYQIPLNPFLQEIFSCSESEIKLSQKAKNEMYLHVDLKKEQQTSRSALFEAILLLLEEINPKKDINFINYLCVPFVHFGKVRISLKLDEKMDYVKIEIFNLFGSLFGFIVISDKNIHDRNEEDTFMTEEMVKAKFTSSYEESEEDSESSENLEENQFPLTSNQKQESQLSSCATLSYLISILQNHMSLLKSISEDVSTTLLPYLGIDSLRLAELEYHIANSPEFKNCRFKAPYLVPYKTLKEVAEFLKKSKIETCDIIDTEKAQSVKTVENMDESRYRIKLSSQQKRILFVREIEEEQLKSSKIEASSQFDELVLIRFSEFQHDRVTEIFNFLILHHSIFRTQYYQDYQYLISGTECFVAIREEHKGYIPNIWIPGIQCILKKNFKLEIIFNHISIDGRSLSIFYKQFKDLLTNPKTSLPSLHLQYHNYCRSVLEPKSDSVKYWSDYLDFERIELETISSDFSNELDIHTASYLSKQFPIRLQKKFDTKCLQESFSRFELFMAILEMSVRRVLGTSGVFAMGFAVDQRTFPYFQTIGCFTNVLLYLSTNPTTNIVMDNWKKCQETLRTIRKYADIPYEDIAKLSGVKKDLFQIFVVNDVVDVEETSETKKSNKRRVRFQDEAVHLEIENPLNENLDERKKVAKYPMTWYLRHYGNDLLHIEVEYAQELFKKETIINLLEEMFRMINTFHVSQLSDRPSKFQKFSKSSIVYKSDFPKSTVSQIIDSDPLGSKIRYKHKDSIILPTLFSKYLLKKHVKIYCQLLAEHPILLKMPRGPDLIEAVLGVWHAGFYPVPLHNDCQESQIQDTCVGLGLKAGELELLSNLDGFKLCKVAYKRRIFYKSTLFDFAYVTSTSGSTGTPKLVGTSFEGHSNLARQYSTSFQISFKDIIGQVVDPSFDIFFADIVKAFTNGACLLLSRDSIATPAELLECTNVYLMPAFLSRLPQIDYLRNLETLQYGGESLAPQVLKNIHENHKELKVFQEFGLTEQTVYSARRRILPVHSEKNDSEEMRVLGKPYDNVQLKISSFDELCEDLRRGQLVLGGIGIMRGYFGVTKQPLKYFPTGDEVSRRNNGEIVFIGRKDSQVKIRGHRVDLFEIECIALSTGLIEVCSCIAVDNKTLVLFFKLKTLQTMDNSQGILKTNLEKNLVSYKVPSQLIRLNSFPLTRTGKINKKKLEEQLREHEMQPGKTENRNLVKAISNNVDSGRLENFLLRWLQYYSNSKIDSIDADIFSFGVDSIAVMLTMQQLRSEGVEISLKTFFKLKTIRRIAESVMSENGELEGVEKSSKSAAKETRRSPNHYINLNHIQQRILFLSRMTTTDIFRLRFSVSIPENSMNFLQNSINQVIIGNSMLRSKLQRIEGEYRFVLLSGTECYCHSYFSNDESIKIDPFVTRIWLDQTRSQLYISIHHIICDGRSSQIMEDQLKKIIQNGAKGVSFQNSFSDDSPKCVEIPRRLFMGLESWQSIFPSFLFGSKVNKLIFPIVFNKTQEDIPISFTVGYAYSSAVRSVFHISSSFPIATTFANRTENNWDTVSMFANTLPLICGPSQTVESFSEKFYELTENSNIPLNEIIKNRARGDGNFADFALNFHRKMNANENQFEEFCQFPMVLSFSEFDKMAQIEYDSNVISLEAEKVKNEMLRNLGCKVQIENNLELVDIFRKFLTTSEVTEDTDFFAAGGHSLMAMKLIDHLSDQLEIEVPLKLIFAFRTPKALNAEIRKLKESKDPNTGSYGSLESIKKSEERAGDCVRKSEDLVMLSNCNFKKEYVFPLSRQQNQMFYLSQFTENSQEYQLPFIQPFPSTVTPSEIHRSLLMTIQEQSIFRTIFLMNDETGEPYQMVVSMTEAFVSCHLEKVEDVHDLHERIRELCDEPINVLSGQPLLKATFVTSSNKHVAFLHLHHLISDARSTQLTNLTMKSFLEDSKKMSKRLGYTYMDYCCQIKSEEVLLRKLDSEYFEKLTSSVGALKFLQTKRNNVAHKVSIEVRREFISERMKTSGFSDTPFSIFLRIISTSLKGILSEDTSFNIAFPILNRNEKTSNICGYFLNNLVINSADFSTLPSILNANLPYSKLVREVRQSSGRNDAIADVYINCRYDLEFDESDDEVLLDLVPLKLHFSIEFDVDLLANETYRITMRTDRFPKVEMQKMLKEMKQTIEETIAPKVPPQEFSDIIYGLKKDIPYLSINQLYHQFFHTNVTSKFALSSDATNWSYGQTYRKILQYSGKLSRGYQLEKASPIRSDDIIGVIGSKSVETTVICLAIQFAGAAYLPVDEMYPEERKRIILKDASFVFQVFQKDEGLYLLLPRRQNFCISTPFCLSYIITTSGTTGHPKSVAIGANSLSNLCLSSTLTMRTCHSSRIFQFTNFVFDNSVLEVLMTIASQATLVYGTSSFDPFEFEKMIESSGITHCLLFPSLVQSFDISKITKLSYWIVGGERLPQNLLDSALKLGIRIIQNYGPTETTTFAIAKAMKNGNSGCQIGKPSINSKILIKKKSSDGSGELLISGIGIMRGYLNRDKTEYFETINDHIWYPSGDVCRVQNNLEVEFIGRTDSQIKVRGYRVELSEIEKVIESHPNVVSCKSIFEPESQQIHVFYTARVSSLSSTDIRKHCEKILEPQKIPSTFNKIDDFPLTSNSKIDKLKMMELVKNSQKKPVPSEACSIDSELSAIWISLLNCSKPSNSDHFFLIGGHSLLLIRLRHLIQTKLEVQLTVPEILENLKYGEMLKLIRKKSNLTIDHNTLVFFPALYGGCTPYLKLIETLRNSNKNIGNVVLLDEETGDTVMDTAIKYQKQIKEKIKHSNTSLFFVGASSAGTFAFATSQLFEAFDNIIVILLDSGTFWDLIEKLEYNNHEKEMIENLKNYEVDVQTAKRMAQSSWNTLQILKHYQPEQISNDLQLHVLSVDGTDLGWSKYSNSLKVHKINGNHYTMLQNIENVSEVASIMKRVIHE